MQTMVKSIEQVLRLFSAAPSVCRVLSWETHFEQLWLLDETTLRGLIAPDRTLVLVWDREPSGPPQVARISDYISPFDWALAVALLNSRGGSPDALGRVVVVDPGSEPAGEAAGFLRRIQQSDTPVLPWLAVAALQPGKELATISRAIESLRPPARALEVAPSSLACLKDLWVGAITRPASAADRHAIANLLGPRLLLGRVAGDSRVDRRLAALERLLQLLGVCTDAQSPADEPGTEAFPWVLRSEWSAVVTKFVLVDDLHADGWSEFLEQALNAKGHLVVQAAPDGPEAGSLLGLLERGDELKSARGLPGEEWDRRVLFLDLRLFSRRPVREEMAFFDRLLEIARARPGFDADDIYAVDRCIRAGTRETEDYHAALTLLPRLVAEVDPFLPIIVFSSTRQRSVIDRLLRYDNILLDFDKPRLGGHQRDAQLTDSRVRFQRVIRRALQMLEARVLCRRCLRPSGRPKAQEKQWSVLEVFVDESGTHDKRFAVGGIAILHSDSNGPALLETLLHDANMAWGVAEGWPPASLDDPLPAGVPKFVSSTTSLQQLGKLEACVQKARGRVFGFGLVTENCPDEQMIDGLYRAMLREVLEALIFIVLPGHRCDDVPVAIDVATRVSPTLPSWEGGQQLTQEEATRDFGLRFLPGGNYYSLAGDHVHGLVRDVLDTREGHAVMGGLCRARGVTLRGYEEMNQLQEAWRGDGKPTFADAHGNAKRYLRYFTPQGLFDSRHSPLPLQVHYAADNVVRLICRNDVDFGRGVLKDWFKRGFLNERRIGRLWLDASRADAAGRPAEALALVWEGNSQLREPYSLGRWVDLEAEHWARGLDANGFRELTQRLEYSRPREP